MKYRAEIDGLRAVAVVPVVLFHAGVPGFSGGYIGVDVFFVISGYLITTIIAQAISEGRFSILDFYERRARRILPALFLVIVASIPFAMLWMVPSLRLDFFQSIVAVLLFGSNLLFWAEDDYFGHASEEKPLLHTWSLAVEEQFYIVFPLLLMLLMRQGRGLPWRTVIVLTVLSFVACIGAARLSPTSAFYLTPFRAWELGAGALCAFCLMTRRLAPRAGLGLVGLAAILASVFLFSPTTPFPSEFALLPVGGTVLLILFAGPETPAGRLLALKPVVGIGLISYSAYLWHQPLLAFARLRLGEVPPWLTAVLIVATFVLAALSWYFVEQPVRTAKRYRREGRRAPLGSRAGLFAASGAVAAVLMSVAVAGVAQQGFRGAWDARDVAGYRWDNTPPQEASWAPVRRAGFTGTLKDSIESFPEAGGLRVLLVGNSHAKDLYNALSANPALEGRVDLAAYGTQLHELTEDAAFFEAPNFRDADVVVLTSRYEPPDIDALPDLLGRIQAAGKRAVLVAHAPLFVGDKAVTRADMIVASWLDEGDDLPLKRIADTVNAQYWADLGRREQQEVALMNGLLAAIATDAGVLLLDRMDYLCEPERARCAAMGDDLTKYYYDDNHTTLEGAEAHGRRMAEIGWFDPVLAEVRAGEAEEKETRP